MDSNFWILIGIIAVTLGGLIVVCRVLWVVLKSWQEPAE